MEKKKEIINKNLKGKPQFSRINQTTTPKRIQRFRFSLVSAHSLLLSIFAYSSFLFLWLSLSFSHFCSIFAAFWNHVFVREGERDTGLLGQARRAGRALWRYGRYSLFYFSCIVFLICFVFFPIFYSVCFSVLCCVLFFFWGAIWWICREWSVVLFWIVICVRKCGREIVDVGF